MKRVLLAYLLLSATLLWAAPVPEEQRLPVDLRRTTLVVQDIERSLQFYQDAIGMEVIYDNMVYSPRDAGSVENANSALRLVFLRANDDFVGILGMMQYIKPAKEIVDLTDTSFRPGSIVLVFNSENIDESFAKAKAIEGVKVRSEPTLTTYPSYDGSSTISVKVSVMQDPDGFTIELNQLQQAIH